MSDSTNDFWKVLSTARTIRRFTNQPVDDETLARCLQAANWAPSGANAQARRFIVLRSPSARAAMTSSSCVNPSLTYMALTARAAAHAADELARGAL